MFSLLPHNLIIVDGHFEFHCQNIGHLWGLWELQMHPVYPQAMGSLIFPWELYTLAFN